MKRFGKLLLVTLGFGVFGFAMSLVPQKTAVGVPTTTVQVTNTPLPVTGSVATTQSGSWNVGINGTPSVNVATLPSITGSVNATITGTPNVNVSSLPPIGFTSSPANPVFTQATDNPADEPFTTVFCAQFNGPTASCTQFNPAPPTSFSVPSTTSDGRTVKRLVIEYVGGTCYGTGSGLLPLIPVLDLLGTLGENNVGNSQVAAVIPMPPPAISGIGAQAYGQLLRAYFDPGTSVTLFTLTEGGAGAFCSIALNGYLVAQ